MLVICYGMAKSGSTLAYELVKGVLIDAGHDQKRVESIGMKPNGDGNYVADLTREVVTDMIAAVGPDRIVAAKTHKIFSDDMFSWMEELQEQRKIQVVASYRDPRDICLSLVDHGARSREAGRHGFAQIGNLKRAGNLVERAIQKFRKWSSLKGSLRLYFETVAFAPDEAIDAVERVLGVSSNHENVKRHAFEDAFTQKNKAKKNRFEEEMDEKNKKMLTDKFSEFIEMVCKNNDERWFTKYRDGVLAGVPSGTSNEEE